MVDHLVDVVDENDEVIGQEFKSKKIEIDFISRVSAIFLMDSKNNFLICRRSPKKKINPDMYDVSACGNVAVGESYEDAAIRELKEELGISCPLRFVDKFYEEVLSGKDNYRFFCAIFIGKTNETPVFNDELVELRTMSFKEIEKEIIKHKEHFCPGFIQDFNHVKEKLKKFVN